MSDDLPTICECGDPIDCGHCGNCNECTHDHEGDQIR